MVFEMNIMIRVALPQDSTQLSEIAIRSKAHWPYDQFFLELCRNELIVSPENIANGNFFLAELNGEVVGFYSFTSRSGAPEMNNLFVLPEFIGRGLGLRLWNHAIDFARTNGWDHFVMDADPYAAEKFYYKIGCKKIGEIESTVLKGRFIPKLRFDIPQIQGADPSYALNFRPIARHDFTLLQKWLAAHHVKEWWHDDFDENGIEAKYGPRVDGIEPTHVHIIIHNVTPIGLIQWYRWADYPVHAAQLGAESTAAGIDLAIGEEHFVSKGIGSKAISEFLRQIVFKNPDVTSVVADPEERNQRSLRAFYKVGFIYRDSVQLQNEDFKRSVVAIDRAAFPP